MVLTVVHHVVLVLAVMVVGWLVMRLLVDSIFHGKSLKLIGTCSCSSDIKVHVETLLLLFHQIFNIHCVSLVFQITVLLLYSQLAK